MTTFSRPMEEGKERQQLERWHRDMLKLQSLVDKGNWPDDTDSKSFAQHICEHMCEDLLRRISECKSHGLITIVDNNPASDSDTERIRASKMQLNLSDSSCLNLGQSPITARKRPQHDDQKGRMAGSKSAICKNDKNSMKKQKLEDRNGKIMNQIIVRKEEANDGVVWRKYGSKRIQNEIYPRNYYKCASKGCPGKKTEQVVDHELIRIVYYDVHNCGMQCPLVMQHDQHDGSEQNAGPVVNEAQPEQQQQQQQHQSPIIPQEIRNDMMGYCQPNAQQEPPNDHWLQLQPPVDEIRLDQYNDCLVPQFQQQQQPPIIPQEEGDDNNIVLSSQNQVRQEQPPNHLLQLLPPIEDIRLQQYNDGLVPQFQQQQQQPPIIPQDEGDDNNIVLSSQNQGRQEQQPDHLHQLLPPIEDIRLEQYNAGLVPQF